MKLVSYKSLDYRVVLEEFINIQKKMDDSLTFAKLAQSVQIQPSYLTNVLKKRADLNSDQLYFLAQKLNCTKEETDYFLLLLEYTRTQIPTRKAQLKEQIENIKKEKLSAKNVLQSETLELTNEQIAEFYLDPLNDLILMQCSLDKMDISIETLSAKFSISTSKTKKVLNLLEKLNLITFKDGKWKTSKITKHLPKESPLCKPLQAQQRLLALEKLQKTDEEEFYSFSATISADASTKEAIKIEFLNFLKSVQQITEKAPSKELFQLNFDLFSW